MATCSIIKSAPVYLTANLTSKIPNARTVIGSNLPYFGSQEMSHQGAPLIWFEIEWEGQRACIVAVSGGTYALIDDHDEAPDAAPKGGSWDILLHIACKADIASAHYGFSAECPGAAQIPNPEGWAWPMNAEYNNCITWTAQGLQVGRHELGIGGEFTKANYLKTVLADRPYDRAGGAAVAYEIGVGEKPINVGGAMNFSGTLEEGWYIGQGLNEGADGRLDTDDDTGHGFFFYVLADGSILILESRGKARGGSLGGQDGVGSRCCTPRNARDWTPGPVAVQTHTI